MIYWYVTNIELINPALRESPRLLGNFAKCNDSIWGPEDFQGKPFLRVSRDVGVHFLSPIMDSNLSSYFKGFIAAGAGIGTPGTSGYQNYSPTVILLKLRVRYRVLRKWRMLSRKAARHSDPGGIVIRLTAAESNLFLIDVCPKIRTAFIMTVEPLIPHTVHGPGCGL